MLRIKTTPFLFRNSTPKYLPESCDVDHHYGMAILTIVSETTILLAEVNQEFLQVTGRAAADLLGINLCENPIWNDGDALWQAICLCLQSRKTQTLNWIPGDVDAKTPLNCSIVPAFSQDEGGKARFSSLSVIISNNAADRAFADQIQKYNYYDHLTGLPNKNYLNEIFHDAISAPTALGDDGAENAVLLINILKFQRINESFSYEYGDDVIRNFVDKINPCLPDDALFCRFEGDKFAILLTAKTEGAVLGEAEALADAIHYEMRDTVYAGEHKIHLELAIGIAIGGADSRDGSLLMQQAHIAMRRLNSAAMTRTMVYRPELQTRASSRLKLENDLRAAIKKNELSLNYQPIVSLQTGRLLGFEALCRWNHGERGAIPPSEFIPLAEESRLIVPLGLWAIRESCRSLKTWIDNNPNCANLIMNVNVTGLQLLQDDFVSTVQDALLNARLPGRNLKLEITETTLIKNSDVVRDILLDLKALDVALAIDDFGTGYSSLSYLNRFPADTLKIDRCFVSNMNASEDSFKIIYIISTLAHTLGMNLVAEGIEDIHQVQALKKLGCQAGQGYLFARPLSYDDAETYIRDEVVFVL